jgi:hypothetical protein
MTDDFFGLVELALDVPGNQLDGEQVADVQDLRVLLEVPQIRERHLGLQLGHALVGDAPVLDEVGIALKDRLGEQFAPRDLDAELPLEAEDDVQKVVDGPQVALGGLA